MITIHRDFRASVQGSIGKPSHLAVTRGTTLLDVAGRADVVGAHGRDDEPTAVVVEGDVRLARRRHVDLEHPLRGRVVDARPPCPGTTPALVLILRVPMDPPSVVPRIVQVLPDVHVIWSVMQSFGAFMFAE